MLIGTLRPGVSRDTEFKKEYARSEVSTGVHEPTAKSVAMRNEPTANPQRRCSETAVKGPRQVRVVSYRPQWCGMSRNGQTPESKEGNSEHALTGRRALASSSRPAIVRAAR